MRPIKFREAILKRNGDFLRWHYWGYIQDGFISPSLPTTSKSYQFMGELDKNEKEVCEGDILAPMDNDFRPEYKGNWVVVYEGGTFAAEGNSERISTWIPYWVPEKQIEIIGNICENPDLLN